MRRAVRPTIAATILGAAVLGLAGGYVLGRPAEAAAASEVHRVAAAAVEDGRVAGIDLDADGQPDLARPTDHPARGVDAYGSGAFGAPRDGGRRAHGGLDLIARHGEVVLAPFAGVVRRVGLAYPGDPSLTYLEIANPTTRYTARILYVAPEVETGGAVAAGQVIGRAQDLSRRYPAGITNHVHVEILGRHGNRLDPRDIFPDSPAPRQSSITPASSAS